MGNVMIRVNDMTDLNKYNSSSLLSLMTVCIWAVCSLHFASKSLRFFSAISDKSRIVSSDKKLRYAEQNHCSVT